MHGNQPCILNLLVSKMDLDSGLAWRFRLEANDLQYVVKLLICKARQPNFPIIPNSKRLTISIELQTKRYPRYHITRKTQQTRSLCQKPKHQVELDPLYTTFTSLVKWSTTRKNGVHSIWSGQISQLHTAMIQMHRLVPWVQIH